MTPGSHMAAHAPTAWMSRPPVVHADSALQDEAEIHQPNLLEWQGHLNKFRLIET